MTKCPSCSKILSSDQALRQHHLDKHGRHLCLTCSKSFNSSNGLRMHSESKHGGVSSSKTPSRQTQGGRKRSRTDRHSHKEPFPGIQGYWDSRESFTGTKSFGYFECNRCSKEWFSAHAHKQFKQGCQACERMAYPCCLWVNTGEKDDYRDKVLDEDEAPHDRARCQACRHGQCQAARIMY